MSKYAVRVVSVVNTTVRGTCDGKTWEAAPFFWGGKVLMKVSDEFRSQFGQGEKVVIGQHAKDALRRAETALPPAPEGKRGPRSTSVAAPVSAPAVSALVARIAQLEALLAARLEIEEGPDAAPAE